MQHFSIFYWNNCATTHTTVADLNDIVFNLLQSMLLSFVCFSLNTIPFLSSAHLLKRNDDLCSWNRTKRKWYTMSWCRRQSSRHIHSPNSILSDHGISFAMEINFRKYLYKESRAIRYEPICTSREFSHSIHVRRMTCASLCLQRRLICVAFSHSPPSYNANDPFPYCLMPQL